MIPLCAYARESFMDKCIQSWVGYPLDSVIKKWGYPDQEKHIAGKTLYIWETYDYDNEIHTGGTTVISKDKKGRRTIYTSGGETIIEYCKKTIETDKNNIIINGQWDGNACPNFYMTGKKLVNPENDEWAKKKAEKKK